MRRGMRQQQDARQQAMQQREIEAIFQLLAAYYGQQTQNTRAAKLRAIERIRNVIRQYEHSDDEMEVDEEASDDEMEVDQEAR